MPRRGPEAHNFQYYTEHIYAAKLTMWALSETLFFYFAELAQIKSTPTDSELAIQIDETESKVRVCIHRPLFVSHNQTHFMLMRTRFLFDRSQNSANTSSLCVQVRLSSQQLSLTRWTPSGLNGGPNGSGEEKYSTSALALFLSPLASPREYPHAPTD